MSHQLRQQLIANAAARGDFSIAIHLQMPTRAFRDEGIDQHSAGTRVECDQRQIIQRRAGLQVRRVADAADILNDTPRLAIAKQPKMS